MELTIPLFQVKPSNCEPLWGDGRKDKIEFDQNKCVFDILSFNNFVFAWTELRSAASNIRDWWDLVVQCSKYLYSKGNHRIANPFGAMDARKKSNSIKKNTFSTFCHSTCLDEVGFFEKTLKFWKVVYPPRMSPFGLKICGDVCQTILQKKCSQDVFWLR